MSLSKPVEMLTYELTCPICLQLYSDPLALPCGHNYCRACIFKTTDMTGTMPSRCPECREEYQGMGSLQRNFKLSNIIEGYRVTAPTLDKPQETLQNVEVYCEHCIDEQCLAVKTCLKCEVSLCSRHLQRHHEKDSFKSHSLVEPLLELGMKVCEIHQRPLDYFCSSDMTLLCSLCFTEGLHNDHDVLTFSVAEEEMRRALETRNKVISNKLQMTGCLLQKTVDDQGASDAIGDKLVNRAVTLVDRMAELLNRYKEKLNALLEEEQSQRKKSWQLELSMLEKQQQKLLMAQQYAKQALNITDPCTFIHRFVVIEQKMREAASAAVPSNIPMKPPINTKQLHARLKTKDFSSEITHLLDSLRIILNPLDLTFSASTAHPNLIVSNDLHTIKYSAAKQSYPDHPERFTSAPQVLCTQGFSNGEHVWVVEVGANSMWSLGVCYKSIPRRGDHSRLGHNSVSWRLQWKNGKLTVCQSSSNAALGEMTPPPTKIEIALDYEGGTLTFHSTKGRREHLHTFRAAFREPVYPAFSIHSNTSESWITLQSGI